MDDGHKKHNPEWFEWYDAAVFGLAVIVLCFTFVVRIVTVDGHSMEPTLSSGQRVAVQSAFYRPQRGDVVVVDSYSRYGDMLVKRVVGAGGDVIDIDFESGIVYRNGEALEEPYVLGPTTLSYDIQFPITVPQGSVFLLGDNRNGSTDSRHSGVGSVHRDCLLGRAVAVIWPLDHLRLL